MLFDYYVFISVFFGDCLSGIIVIIILREIIELLEDDYLKVVDVVKNSSYIDDIFILEISIEDVC